jgi:hypothetical protein
MRKGRFDEIFFVDLPAEDERDEIFAIHIRKRGRDPAHFDLKLLAAVTDGFSGAEIEQVVVASLYDAFDAGRDVEMEDLLRNSTQSIPLSRTMKEQIDALREWAVTRARPASSQSVPPVIACEPVSEEPVVASRQSPEGDVRREPLDGPHLPEDGGHEAGASPPAPEPASAGNREAGG